MKGHEARTVCKLCGLRACGMLFTLRDGRAVEVKGDPEHPENRGTLSPYEAYPSPARSGVQP